MADRNETIADIRKDAEAKFRELVEAYMQRRSAFQTTVGAMQAFNNVFDRFEAAHKREAVTGSNQLRDALDKARRFIDSSPLVSIVDDTGTIARGELCAEIDAALAAPATAEKSSAVGDVAKLREALEFCVKGMCGFCRMDAEARGMTTRCVRGCEALLMAKAALAAPPRNCEKYTTADEAMCDYADEALIEEWNALKAGKDRDMLAEELFVFTKWLFAPATEKEGGAK